MAAVENGHGNVVQHQIQPGSGSRSPCEQVDRLASAPSAVVSRACSTLEVLHAQADSGQPQTGLFAAATVLRAAPAGADATLQLPRAAPDGMDADALRRLKRLRGQAAPATPRIAAAPSSA